MKLALIYTE